MVLLIKNNKQMGVFSKLKRHHWDLAFVEPQDGDWLKGNWKFSWVKYSTKKQWFADPFILDVTDDSILLLAEEFTYSRGIGRIAKLTIDRRSLILTDVKILLDVSTHLSFPAILRHEDGVYVYPENGASGQQKIYKYNPDSGNLDFVSVLIDAPVSDAIIVTGVDTPTIFATAKPSSNGQRLAVFTSDKLMGEYEKAYEIEFEERVARNAGAVFLNKGKPIRPAQIFEGKYGYGVGMSFQEVKQTGGKIILEELTKVRPPKGYEAMHTFNTFKGYTVVDAMQYNAPFVHRVLSFFKHKILQISD